MEFLFKKRAHRNGMDRKKILKHQQFFKKIYYRQNRLLAMLLKLENILKEVTYVRAQ